MSQTKQFVMTYEGVKKLEEELEYLKTVKRKEITEKIKVALGYGDLSENSEYDEAKNDQAFTEGRILQLENMLKNAIVVDESELPNDVVSVGTIVKVKDYDFDEEVEYTIVKNRKFSDYKFILFCTVAGGDTIHNTLATNYNYKIFLNSVKNRADK